MSAVAVDPTFSSLHMAYLIKIQQVAHDMVAMLPLKLILSAILSNTIVMREGFAIDLMPTTDTSEYILYCHSIIKSRVSHVRASQLTNSGLFYDMEDRDGIETG